MDFYSGGWFDSFYSGGVVRRFVCSQTKFEVELVIFDEPNSNLIRLLDYIPSEQKLGTFLKEGVSLCSCQQKNQNLVALISLLIISFIFVCNFEYVDIIFLCSCFSVFFNFLQRWFPGSKSS